METWKQMEKKQERGHNKKTKPFSDQYIFEANLWGRVKDAMRHMFKVKCPIMLYNAVLSTSWAYLPGKMCYEREKCFIWLCVHHAGFFLFIFHSTPFLQRRRKNIKCWNLFSQVTDDDQWRGRLINGKIWKFAVLWEFEVLWTWFEKFSSLESTGGMVSTTQWLPLSLAINIFLRFTIVLFPFWFFLFSSSSRRV